MNKKENYDIALSFWTASFQYLRLVENSADEIVAHGNTWVMGKDFEYGPITHEGYENATRWSDHTLIIPLLFNLYHGIELLLKGFLLMKPDQKVKPKHSIERLSHQFNRAYPDEVELNDFLVRFTDEQCLPALLANFLTDNNLTLNDLYQAVRYPSDHNFHTLRKYVELKYQGKEGLPFFQNLASDINVVRVAAVRLGRSLGTEANNGQQKG